MSNPNWFKKILCWRQMSFRISIIVKFCVELPEPHLPQGLAVKFSHRQVYVKRAYTWRRENITARPCVNCMYPTVTSARSCNKVDHLFWFTILAQHETNDVILYIHGVHKHRGNYCQRQNYKMRLKQRSLNWINCMQGFSLISFP